MRRKFFAAFAVVMALVCARGTVADAQNGKVSVRIEGLTECLFEDTIDSNPSNVFEALCRADEMSDAIEITMQDSSYGGKYISSVNNLSEKSHGETSGWMVRVNGKAIETGISEAKLNPGDSVVLYFSDEFGVGMQYPVMDASDVEKGVLVFTSTDVTYDESYNPVTNINPVKGATVKWYVGESFREYVTDEKGKITIDKDALTKGKHRVSIEKSTANGVPLVLRFSRDTTVSVKGDIDSYDETNAAGYVIACSAGLLLAGGVVLCRKSKKFHY